MVNMANQNKNTPSIALVEKMKQLCRDCGEIQSDRREPFFGEILITIQKGKMVFVRRNEIMK